MRIDIVGLKDALERNVGVWEVEAEEAERLAARFEAFDPASLGLEGEGYSALRGRIASRAPLVRSQASLLRSLSEGCARNLDAAALLEPSEPDGSVDTDHLADELSHARGGAEEWGERSDDFSWAGPLDELWRCVCDSMRQLKEAEAAEYERKIRLVEEYAAKSSTFYVGAASVVDDAQKDSNGIMQDLPEGEDGDQAELYHLWWDKDPEKRARARKWISERIRKEHPDWTDKQISDYLEKLSDEGCGYVADINTLMQEYSIPDLRTKFGIPDEVPDECVKDWLLLDYYASQDNHNPGPNGGDEMDPNEDPSSTQGRGTSPGDRKYRFTRWLKTYGITVHMSQSKSVKGSFGVVAIALTLLVGEITHRHVVLRISPLYMYDCETGEKYPNPEGSHAVTVLGVDDKGRIIVSSWGKRYYVDPQDYGPDDTIAYETVDYE